MIDPLATPNASKNFPLFMFPIRRYDNEDRNGLADYLVGLVSKEPFRAPIESRNNPIEILADDGVIRGFDYRGEGAGCLFEITPRSIEFRKSSDLRRRIGGFTGFLM
jgi:hypothetical protein